MNKNIFLGRIISCILERRLPNELSRIFALFGLLVSHPSQIPFVYLWFRYRLRGGPLDNKIPWITFRAFKWLKHYLRPNMVIFEYGSGGSTIFISKKAKEIISVEHDRNWYKDVARALYKEKISNCKYVLREPVNIADKKNHSYNYKNYTSVTMPGVSFEDYVKTIEKYPDKNFNLVFIDGRARASCIFHAIPKVRPKGYIMLDNSDRWIYEEAISLLSKYKREDFFSIGPINIAMWKTSIWRIDE